MNLLSTMIKSSPATAGQKLLVCVKASDCYDRGEDPNVGASEQWRILVVCHCYRADDDVIRIISARVANPWERQMYGGRWRG